MAKRKLALDTSYIKNVAFYFLSAVVSIIMIIFIVFHMTESNANTAETAPVMEVGLSRTLTAQAFVIREEQLVFANTMGHVYSSINPGARVRAGQQVIEIFRQGSPISRRLMELDTQIRILEQSNTSGSGSHYLSILDNQINRLHMNMIERADSGDLLFCRTSATQMQIYLNRRNVASRAIDSLDDEIARLTAEKNSLLAQSQGEIQQRVNAPAGGNFFPDVDGYEEVFRVSYLNNMTISRFNEMASANPNLAVAEGRPNAQGRVAVARIMTDTMWHIAMEVPVSEIRELTAGQIYEITFVYNGNITFEKTLQQIITEFGNEYGVIVFGSRNVPENFEFMRTQTVEITVRVYGADRRPIERGLQVPGTAVRYVDGQVGVFLVNTNARAIFRPVRVIKESDGMLILCIEDSQVGRFDLIVISGHGIEEERLIR
ncbi:MAG: hypothetical protein FWB93_03955 [Oscillospiraceae bacterium]|nr:hypothetical protein [Oscillospiraceae bacterium]